MNMPLAAAAPEVRTVPSGRGTEWIGEGFALFRQAPGTWIGMLAVWILLNAVMGSLGGQLISTFLNPILQAGMMLGCVSLSKSEGLRVGHLFEAFKGDRIGSLLMMGLIQLGLTLALGAVVVVALLTSLPGLWESGSLNLEHMDFSHLDIGKSNILALLLVGLLAAALAVPLAMLGWFAPVLIILRGLTAWEAMKLSLHGCLLNWKPFLLYGLVALGLLLVAALPLLLGLLVVLPILAASIYTSYRDIYTD